MRRGQRESSSSGSDGSQQPWSKGSEDQSTGSSSDEDSLSFSDVEAENAMKRSQRFSGSFSFEEDQQLQSTIEDGDEELFPNKSNIVTVTQAAASGVDPGCVRTEKTDTLCDTNQPRSGLFRPQALWLAMTRCLSLRWPPCLSVNRQSTRKLAYQVDLDQSEDTHSSASSESTNDSSSSTSSADDQDVSLVKPKEEEVRSRGVKSAPLSRRGISRSSPRLPRARQAADSVFASIILEKEMFLRVELVDSGEERDDLRYRAEWKLSERTRELAEGVWLSRSPKAMD